MHHTPPKNPRLDEEAAEQLAAAITEAARGGPLHVSRARSAHYKSWGNVVDVHGPGYRIIVNKRTPEVEALFAIS